MLPSRDVVSLWKSGRDFWRPKGAVTTRRIFMQLVLLRRKLHHKLRSVTYRDKSAHKFVLLPQALQKVGLDSTFRNNRDNDFIDVFTVAQSNSRPCNLSRNALLDQPIGILNILSSPRSQCSCSCNATHLNVAKQVARKKLPCATAPWHPCSTAMLRARHAFCNKGRKERGWRREPARAWERFQKKMADSHVYKSGIHW